MSRKNNFRFKIKEKKARSAGYYFIYGKNAALSCLECKKRNILEILIQQEKNEDLLTKIPKELHNIIKIKSKDELTILSQDSAGKHQGIVIKVEKYRFKNIAEAKFNQRPNIKAILLDEISDPQNLGAILRSCYCFGINDIILYRGCDDITSAVVRTSAGYSEHLNIYKITDLQNELKFIKNSGFSIVCMDSNENSSFLEKYLHSEKELFVFGSEGFGISENIKKISDISLKINIRKEADSLNVSNAVAIVCFKIMNS